MKYKGPYEKSDRKFLSKKDMTLKGCSKNIIKINQT